MATSFTVNKADLEFILRQIKISEATSIGYTPAVAPVSIQQAIMTEYGLSAADAAIAPFGLRTVDGSFNSLVAGQSQFGAADTLFPRLTDPVYRNEGDETAFNGETNTNYGAGGNVVDSDPRIISNLIVDMSVNNPAAIAAYLGNPLSLAQFEADHPGMNPVAPGGVVNANDLAITNTDLQTIPNQSPDIGLSPGFNAWMTFFGQFFDHGLDLVTKGSNGTVYVPLQADDPLIAGADHVLGTPDDLPLQMRFMALTRATPTMVDPDGAGPLPAVPQHQNTTTSFVDQNQTYTSHPSHQVFLREYVKVDLAGDGLGPVAVSTGRLIDGTTATGSLDKAIGNWADVKAQALTMLGIRLDDFDVHNVPLLLTDQYGKFIPGANGYAQMVMAPDLTHETIWVQEGTVAGITTAGSIGTNHAFLNDIAHHAAPGFLDANHDGIQNNGELDQVADSDPGVGDDGLANTYDDEMLNAHFITGDGRGNENIALTTVHSIFHSEHNRLVDVNKATILASGDVAFLNEWLLVDQATDLTATQVAALNPVDLAWDGERLFQAARFGTEMQYQHLVFEEFARRMQPMVDPFIFNTSPDIDPSIVAEFAHTVYRFGHSMLTGTVDRLENDLTTVNGEMDQKTLLAVFLNPQAYIGSGATLEQVNANIIRGLSRDVGNALDEFIVTDVRSNLLGLPLDLAVLNLARGRDTGIPSLNETRAQLYNDTGLADLKPYASWIDFAENIKNAASVVNFIAAYGTHASILAQTTLAGKRAAAEAIVFNVGAPSDRDDFINGTGIYASDLGGLNDVDLWIGGLAEKINEFGGMLGSTFNFVFEAQMESLQFGDRMYYLTRTQGLNFLNQLEPNTFSDLVMRNTELGDIYSTHLNGALFVTPDHILELDSAIAQTDYDAGAGIDPLWAVGEPHSIFATKVTRSVSGNQVLGPDGKMHDVGGTLKFLGGEHVVLGGTEGNDTLLSDRGIDTIWGDGGDDYINAGMESDDVFGGEGDDIIEDPFGDDVLRGNQGNDVITAARGADLLFGDQGTDYIVLGQDASEVFGGTGADFILGGAGKDFLLGNEGDDWIEGGSGFDTIAGENSELFFNSPIIGHDVLFGQGDETDYDAESGDDIMGSGPSVFRYEGMFGFDWGIAKNDISGVKFDLQIPIFTTIPTDVLRDRFDQVEALSGWKYSDILDGDDRGHKGGGSSAPDSVPTELFADHVLTQEGIDRIAGLERLMGDAIGAGANAGARQTLFGTGVPGAQQTSYRDGNILMGGDGNDFLRGRGGYDILDGDAWLNVRIKIVVNGVTYSSESMSTDTTVMGEYAGKVFNVYTAVDQAANPSHTAGSANFASPAFGGVSLTSLLLDRTINPGDMTIVREILNSDGSQVAVVGSRNDATDVDTAVFQGTLAEYEIEGRGTIIGGNTQAAFDLNGDGFISVRDKDTGLIGAVIDGPDGQPLQLPSSRGNLTDDTDLVKNIERLQFADQTIRIGGTNDFATGVVTIGDPTPGPDGLVTPYVGQVLVPTLTGISALEAPLDPATGLPVGLNFEWQTTEFGNNSGWSTIQTSQTYTVRSVDPGHILRAVAVFKDGAGVTERIYSVPTDNPTVAFSVNENSLSGTIVGSQIPFNVDYDPESINGNPPPDVDLATLYHEVDPAFNAGGRFKIVLNGVDFNGFPRYSLVVDQGGPVLLDYEAAQTPVDNQYQIIINTYDTDPALGGTLVAVRQFTILLNDVANEAAPVVNAPTDINWNGVRPSETALPATGVVIANLSTVDLDNSAVTFSNVGADTSFIVTPGGQVSRTGGLAQNTTYVLSVKAQETAAGGGSFTEVLNIRTGTTTGNNIAGSGLTDIIYGLGGTDTLNGAGGNDTLFGQDGTDTLNGGDGNDVLTGGDDNDNINGGAGNDTIHWSFANGITGGGTDPDDESDTVDGGADTDTLIITGSTGGEQLDVVFNGTAITEIEGGGSIVNVEAVTANLLGGTDTLDYDGTTADVTVDLTAGTASGFTSIAGIENASGDAGNDTLIGLAGQTNALSGGNGNDTFTVHDTADTVSEDNNSGTDTVLSLATAYTITDTDVENLTLLGSANINGTGNNSANVITGNAGNNIMNGSGGTDTVSYANAAAVTVTLASTLQQNTLGAGLDTLSNFENLTGSAQGDTLTGNTSANVLSGGGGNDTLVATVDNVRDTLDGGANTDTANYATYAAALTVDLGGAAPIVVGGSGSNAANSDVVVGIENFTSGSGNDTLTGSIAANILNAGGGNDTIIYNIGGGADTIDGGAGTGDTLNVVGTGASEALDVIWNGTAITQVEGGTVVGIESVTANLQGNGATGDTVSYTGTTNDVTVNLATGAASGFSSITNFENATGGSGADRLTGSGTSNALNGGIGADILIGGGGADAINMGVGGDDAQDVARFGANTEYGDTITNFDANGTATQIDMVQFAGALNTLFDDGTNNDDIAFVSGNGSNGGNTAVDLNGTVEALYLSGNNGEGVNSGGGNELDSATAVATEFNAEFAITAANGEATLLVINDTNANSAAVWQYVENGTTAEIQTNELTLIGMINANATVTTGSFDFTADEASFVGTGVGETLTGDGGDNTISGLGGNDTINANGGNDTIIQTGATDGRDFVDGGAGLVDTYQLNGVAAVETFKIYTRAEALSQIAGLVLNVNTEIVVTRQLGNVPVGTAPTVGNVIAELDNIEEIIVNTTNVSVNDGNGVPNGGASGGDTIQVIGNFAGPFTSLNYSTITIDGNAGDDTVDISALSSAHRIVFRSNGGNDTIVGNMRPQDVIELPAGATAADYTTTTANGVSTMTNGTHSVSFTAPSGMPQVGHDDDEDDDDDSAGNDDDNDDTAANDDDDDCGRDDDDDTDTTGGTGTTAPGAGVVRTGTPQADVLSGTAGDDDIIGLAGDDVATGGAGADTISGGEGADFGSGGDGRDVIFAGAGDDQVFGGGDADVIYGDAGADRIFGNEGNDLITAGAGDDAVFGGAGNDLIVAEIGDGNDVYFGDDSDGGTGVDTLDMSAATANVTVNLGSGTLSNGIASSSQTGNDTIWGIENVNTGSGQDTITASNAVNVMNGGGGNDTFKFTSASAADGDTIVGFEPGDRVDLTAIDANASASGDQTFTLVTGAPLAAGQLAVTHETRGGEQFTVVQGNIDGGDADFTVEIAGHHNLTNANLGL